MKTQKMSLANIQGKMSRTEMKKIMAGSGGGSCTIEWGPICRPGLCPHICFNPAPLLICCG
jgi:hypothetical protein